MLDKEQAAFEEMMSRNTARLTDFARPYIARLSNADRGELLHDALYFAWQRRKSHKPEAESLLQYWDRCLKAAAMKRRSWLVSTFDGWINVLGKDLGSQQ